MFKKGQAAMEFLMTYGWAILVVLAAIGALAYFGVLSPDNLLPERTSFQAPIPNIDNAYITTDGAVEIAFSSNVGYAINIKTASASMTGIEVAGVPADCTTGTTVEVNGVAADTDVVNNGKANVKWTCLAAGNAAVAWNKGDRVKGTLTFTYTNSYTGQTRSHTGTINGKVS